jgi:hypothetical protein
MEGQVCEDDRVMATVITDGMENSSSEYSGKTIKALVGFFSFERYIYELILIY